MFIKVTVTHEINPKFGRVKNEKNFVQYINTNSVFKFYKNQGDDCTTLKFMDGKFAGVAETPEEIFIQIK